MKPTQPVILPVRHSLGDGGNEVKDPFIVGGVPSPREAQAMPWILRCAQNDRIRVFLGLLLVLGCLFLAPRSFAATTEPTDLGFNLSYLRVHSLADATPALGSALSASHAFVLDLRYATANDESVAVLRSALARHPREGSLFILISPATPAAVVEAINQTPGGCISLGATSTRSARIEVKADPAADRRAYDAWEAGTPVEALISGKIEKERFDEATLVQEFKNGNHDADLPGDRPGQTPAGQQTGTVPPPGPDPTTAKPGPPETREAPLIDRVLQRAVQLHQAMLALRRTAG